MNNKNPGYTVKVLEELKGRLNSGTLTKEDITRLEDIISKLEEVARIQENSTKTIAGRKVIAQLPLGMDIVK